MTKKRRYRRYGPEFKREALTRACEEGVTDVIVFEMLPLQSLTTRHEQTVEMLQSSGYRVFLIAKYENRHLAGLQAIDTFTCPTEAKQSDYLAVSKDRQDLLAGISVGPK